LGSLIEARVGTRAIELCWFPQRITITTTLTQMKLNNKQRHLPISVANLEVRSTGKEIFYQSYVAVDLTRTRFFFLIFRGTQFKWDAEGGN
jgi:hypothetical protein